MIRKTCKNNVSGYLRLCLFLAGVLVLFMAAYFAYAGPAEEPDAVVNCSYNEFNWNVETDNSGCAMLDIFNYSDANVESVNGDTLIAPGTSGDYFIRMCNRMDMTMGFTVLVYKSAEHNIPVTAEISGNNLQEIDTASLPETLMSDDIVGAYQGTVKGGNNADMCVSWQWPFEGDEEDDLNDTWFGNLAVEEDITYELRVLVITEADYQSAADKSDQNADGTGSSAGRTSASKTGDMSSTDIWLLGIILSAVVMILNRKRQRQEII